MPPWCGARIQTDLGSYTLRPALSLRLARCGDGGYMHAVRVAGPPHTIPTFRGSPVSGTGLTTPFMPASYCHATSYALTQIGGWRSASPGVFLVFCEGSREAM
jgi:hypothetical protein